MLDQIDAPLPDASLQAAIDEFAAIQATYRARLGEMVEGIVAGWAAFVETREPAALDPLLWTAHRVTGSAGTFGYPAVSEAAAPLEIRLRALIDGPVLPDARQREALDRMIRDLLAAWRQGCQEPPSAVGPLRPASTEGRRCVFIVDDDHALAARIAHQIAQFGYEARVFSELAEAEAALPDARPVAVILDLMFPDGDLAGADLARRFGEQVPIMVMTSRTDFPARLAAARANCAGYLVKPIEIQDLTDWLDDVSGQKPENPLRVLIVDDDACLARHYALTLAGVGAESVVLTEPFRILDAVAETMPDLILMDMYMPGCTGVDLARVVRQLRQYLGIPIVFLSVESDTGRQLAAMRPGVDDFLTKPIRADHLAQAVVIRAERARALRSVMETDSLTGLLNHARLKERLAVELVRAQRQDAPLAFALIDLDHFKAVNDRYGHLTGDRVIRSLARLLERRLRRTDIVGRYGGEEFAVIFTDTHAAEVADVLEEVGRSFAEIRHAGCGGQEFAVTLSGGLAGYVGHGSADALIDAADQALYAAKRAGRNCIVRAGVA